MPGLHDGQLDAHPLEQRAQAAAARSRRSRRCSSASDWVSICDEQRDEGDQEHDGLLEHHHRAADVLVLDRGEPPDPRHGLVVLVGDGRGPGQIEPSPASPNFAAPM